MTAVLGREASAAEDLGDLTIDERSERVVGERVIEVREQQVLPDEDPQLVAQIVELGRLVEAGAGDAEHVHAGVAHQLQRRPQVRARCREPDRIDRGPDRAADEDRHAADVDREPVALDVVIRARSGGQRPEADAPAIDGRRGVATPDRQPHGMQVRLAVGVRPPRGHPRDDQLALDGDRAVGLTGS